MGILSSAQINYLIVFVEGVLSFLSPCVMPLLPVYMGYLAGSSDKMQDGSIYFERKKIMIHTLFFVLGISTAFFLLGASLTAVGRLFSGYQYLFVRLSGVLIIALGLFQLGLFELPFLQKERKIHLKILDRKVNPIIAFLLGFTFSFAWTPCIGPALSSVLVLASGAKTVIVGYLLILVYTIGFTVPFLLLGLFTTQVMNFLRKKQKLIRYTIKASGVLLIILGLMTFTGYMNGVSSYFNRVMNSVGIESETDISIEEKSGLLLEEESKYTAADFTLTDQNGNQHTLSDYIGKVVFINFYATWCSPCMKEMPDIQERYLEYGENEDQIIFLGITNPQSEEYPNNSDYDMDYIRRFIDNNGYTFPTLFDTTGDVFQQYNISAFPTTYIIDREGKIMGNIRGMMTEDIMISVIEEALAKE